MNTSTRRGLLVGIGTFCIFIGIFILFTFPFSYLNGLFGSVIFGLGVTSLVHAFELNQEKEKK